MNGSVRIIKETREGGEMANFLDVITKGLKF